MKHVEKIKGVTLTALGSQECTPFCTPNFQCFILGALPVFGNICVLHSLFPKFWLSLFPKSCLSIRPYLFRWWSWGRWHGLLVSRLWSLKYPFWFAFKAVNGTWKEVLQVLVYWYSALWGLCFWIWVQTDELQWLYFLPLRYLEHFC